MSIPKSNEAAAKGRDVLILSQVLAVFSRLFGKNAEELPIDVPLIELGVDSLFLLQASQVIKSEFGVKIPFRLLLEELSTIEAIAAHLGQKLPASFGQDSAPREAKSEAKSEAQPVPDAPPVQAVSVSTTEACVVPNRVAEQPLPAPSPTAMAYEAVAEVPPTLPASFLQASAFGAAAGVDESYVGRNVNQPWLTTVEHIIAQQLRIGEEQLRLMSLQLEVLHNGSHQPSMQMAPEPESAKPADYRQPTPPLSVSSTSDAGANGSAPARAAEPATQASEAEAVSRPRDAQRDPQAEPETFVAYKPISKATGALDERQRRHLDGLIERLSARTQGSKRLTQQHRPYLANKRATAGYRQLWKELVYPLVTQRGQGSRVWDVDGNEYVDLTMGFGSLLFGHSPAFITEALQEQLNKGLQIGAHTALTGEVAKLIRELTGVERVAFCNSGTEAVMGALRLARTVTGRTKIALFEGCYHGTFDGIMVRGETTADKRLRALPMAPGVPQKMIDDVLLLKYNDPESIEILKEHAHELAAVLIEPPRSRRPDVQPRHFLHELRALTEEAGVALIFDEVVTGFRFHPGGAQAMFGIQADLVTYGKAIGAGVPVAVIAGKAAFMDAVDGGMWNYGDASYPEADITFMTGTYFQHPVIMAALLAALNHIKEQGPRLQEQLAEKTTHIAETLNAYFLEKRVPLSVVYMGSLFRLLYPADLRDIDLFFYHLLEKGVFICETRNCLLSTAHTDEDVEYVIRAFKESTDEMVAGGFLRELSPEPPPVGERKPESTATRPTGATVTARAAGAGLRAVAAPVSHVASHIGNESEQWTRVPLTDGQKQIWALANMGDDGARAYNQSLAVHLSGPLNASDLDAAVQQVIARHEALRATFSPDGDFQSIARALDLQIRMTDLTRFSEHERATEQGRLLASEAEQGFDLARGPLLRVRLLKLAEDHHILAITMHHIISDGWSMGIILRELAEVYAARRLGRDAELSPPDSFIEYARAQSAWQKSSEMQEAEAYWLSQFAGPLPSLDLSTGRPRSTLQTYAGAQRRMFMQPSLYPDLKRLSTNQGCTLFMTLLTGFKVLLHYLTDQQDLIVGIPAAGQLSAEAPNLVGYCVNLLPLRSRVSGAMTFAAYLRSLKAVMADAYDYQDYPYGKLLKSLNLRRDPSRSPLVEAVFNVDHSVSDQKFFDLEMEIHPNHNSSSKFDLTMDVTEGPESLTLDCEYNTNLFSDAEAQLWMTQYETVLESVAANPEVPIDNVRNILREVEQRNRQDRSRQLQAVQLSKFRSAKRRLAS
jgi:glutamate-1-semialdehyde-2,1-aminomutase